MAADVAIVQTDSVSQVLSKLLLTDFDQAFDAIHAYGISHTLAYESAAVKLAEQGNYEGILRLLQNLKGTSSDYEADQVYLSFLACKKSIPNLSSINHYHRKTWLIHTKLCISLQQRLICRWLFSRIALGISIWGAKFGYRRPLTLTKQSPHRSLAVFRAIC